MADAVVTITEDQYHLMKRIKFAVKTATGGAATGTTTNAYDGAVYWVVSDPGGTAPTAAWDFTLTTPAGLDVCQGNGADRSASATEYINTSDGLGAVSNEKLTLTVANGGDEKLLDVYVYII